MSCSRARAVCEVQDACVPFVKARARFYVLIGLKVAAVLSILQEIFIKVFHERQVYKFYLLFGTLLPGENGNLLLSLEDVMMCSVQAAPMYDLCQNYLAYQKLQKCLMVKNK